MKRKTAKFFICVAAAAMVFSLAACAQRQTAAPAPGAPAAAQPSDGANGQYINGVWKYNEPITIGALFSYNPARIDEDKVKDIWLFEYARREMNIDIQPVVYPMENADTVAGLLMASGEYPEAILFFYYNFSGLSQHAQYGDQEGQLIPLNKYLFDPEIMPNVSKIMEEFKADIPIVATGTGNIYQLVTVVQHMQFALNMSSQYFWYDTRVLEQLNRKAPATLGEFTDLLREVKEKDPKNLGVNNIPLGGRHQNYVPFAPVMNSLGFLTGSPTAMVSLVGGRYIDGPGELVTLQDHPMLLEFLKYFCTLYTEELFEQDYFTQEVAQSTAKASQDHYAVWPAYNPNEFSEDSFTSYYALGPMTSEFYDKQTIHTGPAQLGGNYQVFVTDKASAAQAEAMMRFADRCYDNQFRWSAYHGPQVGVDSDYGLGIEGWYFDSNGTIQFKDLETGNFESRSEYLWHVTPFVDAGNSFDRRTDGSELKNLDLTTRNGHWYNEVIKNQIPYLVRGMPNYIAKPEDVTRMNDLGTVLNGIINTEFARFITGARTPNDAEFDAYVSELRASGYDEYCETFINTLNGMFK